MSKLPLADRHSRRDFLKYSSLALGGAMLGGCATAPSAPNIVRARNLNSKLNIAQIGCGGRGANDLMGLFSENVVALCDVNANSINSARVKYPDAKVYQDFREMLAKEDSIDAVDIAIPDHMHAPAAAMAMKMGKHVYCQKPLTHDVFEARRLRELAKQYNVATQMGNQGSALDEMRRAIELIQGGLIGNVRQAYVWTDRPIWAQGRERPPGSDPVPDFLDWDLWLGTAPKRPFKATWPAEMTTVGAPRRYTSQATAGGVYQLFNWRGWLDFGTGALGDMACHTTNWPFRALKLGFPTEIEAQTTGMTKEMYPMQSQIHFLFPAREGLPAVTLTWYDGGNLPPAEVTAAPLTTRPNGGPLSVSGCIMVGDNGMVYAGDDGNTSLQVFVKLKGDASMIAQQNHPATAAIPQSIERNTFIVPDGTAPGNNSDIRHHQEWIAACKGGKPGYSNFDVAAYLTEIMLLGVVAMRVGKKLEWDGPNMKANNAPEAAQFIKRTYRDGWTI